MPAFHSGGGETKRLFRRARTLIERGDTEALRALLDAEPDLVTARWPGPGCHYVGYFHHATLLHHLSGNPIVVPVPSNVVESAALLLEHCAGIPPRGRARQAVGLRPSRNQSLSRLSMSPAALS